MKITIITVCYNSADVIEKAIRSVISQNYSDYEYIIIDGNSNDGTQDIIRKYNKYIAYWCSEKDDGVYDAMNKGIKHSTGDVLAFLNSDDWYQNGIFDIIDRYFQDDSLDMLLGSVNRVREDRVLSVRTSDMKIINMSIPCCHQAVFTRRRVFDEIGLFNTKYKIAADYDWILRVYNSGMNIKCVTDIFANYSVTGLSSKQIYNCIKESEDIAKKNAKRNKREQLFMQIEKYYRKQIKQIEKDNEYEVFISQKYNVSQLKKLLNDSVNYYIWGTGYYGQKCYELFKVLDLNIKGFIDNNKKDEFFLGIPVITPREIDNQALVCISTIKYEKEIKEELEKMHISKNRYCCFSEIQDKVLQLKQ